MLNIMKLVAHSRAGQSALVGLLTAAAVDWQAFKKMQSFHDFASYRWGVAIFRWVQGAAIGAAAPSALAALLG